MKQFIFCLLIIWTSIGCNKTSPIMPVEPELTVDPIWKLNFFKNSGYKYPFFRCIASHEESLIISTIQPGDKNNEETHTLQSINIENGNLIWEYEFEENNKYIRRSCDNIVNNSLILTKENQFFGIDINNGNLLWSQELSNTYPHFTLFNNHLYGFQYSGERNCPSDMSLIELNPENGSIKLIYNVNSNNIIDGFTTYSPIPVFEMSIKNELIMYLPLNKHIAKNKVDITIEKINLTTQSSETIYSDQVHEPAPLIRLPPAIVDNQLIFEVNRMFHSIHKNNGNSIWSTEFDLGPHPTPYDLLKYKDNLILTSELSGDGITSISTQDGSINWSIKNSSCYSEFDFNPKILLISKNTLLLNQAYTADNICKLNLDDGSIISVDLNATSYDVPYHLMSDPKYIIPMSNNNKLIIFGKEKAMAIHLSDI